MELKILKKNQIINCNILQKDYKKISKIITKLQNVIITNENILIFSKNSCMKNLNEMIKKLNETYNQSIIDIFSKNNKIQTTKEIGLDDDIISEKQKLKTEIALDCKNDSLYSDIPEIKSEISIDDDLKSSTNESSDNDESDEEFKVNKKSQKKNVIKKEKKKENKNSINNNYDLLNYNLQIIEDIKKLLIESIVINNDKKNDDTYKELINLASYDPLKNIKDQILLLGKIVGFTSVKDIIYLLYNVNDIHLIDEDLEKFKLINRILCPLNYEIKNISDKKNHNDSLMISKINNSNYITLFNNQCELILTIKNKILSISGYILSDPLNIFIRT